jgi:hypothetical protein
MLEELLIDEDIYLRVIRHLLIHSQAQRKRKDFDLDYAGLVTS